MLYNEGLLILLLIFFFGELKHRSLLSEDKKLSRVRGSQQGCPAYFLFDNIFYVISRTYQINLISLRDPLKYSRSLWKNPEVYSRSKRTFIIWFWEVYGGGEMKC